MQVDGSLKVDVSKIMQNKHYSNPEKIADGQSAKGTDIHRKISSIKKTHGANK